MEEIAYPSRNGIEDCGSEGYVVEETFCGGMIRGFKKTVHERMVILGDEVWKISWVMGGDPLSRKRCKKERDTSSLSAFP
jgi:hypothetical protein